MIKLLLSFSALLGGTGVVLGAFLAHALKNRLSENMLTVFEVGVRYQMYHSIAIFIATFAYYQFQNSWFLYSAFSFLVGTFIFSLSLYLLAVTEIKTIGMITPIGGTLLVIGWILLLVGFLNAKI